MFGKGDLSCTNLIARHLKVEVYGTDKELLHSEVKKSLTIRAVVRDIFLRERWRALRGLGLEITWAHCRFMNTYSRFKAKVYSTEKVLF